MTATDSSVKEAHQLSLGFPTIRQHNILVRHPMRMGLYEARIFTLMLRCIHQKMVDLPLINVSVKDVVHTDKPNKKMYGLIEAACDDLMNKRLNLMEPGTKKKGFDKQAIVTRLKHIEGSGLIQGKFDPDIKDYLLNLSEQFTIGEINQLMRLRNANSHRVYWVLKSWDDKPSKTFQIDEFREVILGPDHKKYSQYGQFKRAILLPAMEELSTIGFKVKYRELQNGKSVSGLEFTFGSKDVKEQANAKATPKPDANQTKKLIDTDSQSYQRVLKNLSDKVLALSSNQVEKIIASLYDEHKKDEFVRIHKFLYTLKSVLRDGKATINNPGAYAYKQLATEFSIG